MDTMFIKDNIKNNKLIKKSLVQTLHSAFQK